MTLPIETLLFDFGGTLDADGVAWKERFYAHYRCERLAMTAEAFAPVFYASDDLLVGDLPLDCNLSDTVQRLTANIEAELARCDGSRAAGQRREGGRGRRVAERFLADAFAAFARNRPLLEALREHYRLGIVANFYGNLEAVCRNAGLASLFAVIVDSRRIGAEKPDPAIFRAALERIGTAPERALLIGDSLRRDRAGARRMGMRFIWIAPRHVQASAAETDGEALDHGAVERLDDLAGLLL